ncbi:hypothetical protein B0T22DRAFT_452540 [Podospora appendiculata]|uniref:Uncharacterized protein n=1 Tax=Podospora appendiculata TaxID=314037 RepID=A0AAE0XJ91_9PEZI|nr:hypothetical protein B0T22DRAFT_452540 [Podospora appendiculata]
MHHSTLCALAVGLLSALPGAQANIYTKKSPVLQVDAKDYDRLVAKSNQTTVSPDQNPLPEARSQKPHDQKRPANFCSVERANTVVPLF